MLIVQKMIVEHILAEDEDKATEREPKKKAMLQSEEDKRMAAEE